MRPSIWSTSTRPSTPARTTTSSSPKKTAPNPAPRGPPRTGLRPWGREIHAFEDTWEWNLDAQRAYEQIVEQGGRVADALVAFKTFLFNSDRMAYLARMAPRLVELRRYSRKPCNCRKDSRCRRKFNSLPRTEKQLPPSRREGTRIAPDGAKRNPGTASRPRFRVP
jgi:hypothetical protein